MSKKDEQSISSNYIAISGIIVAAIVGIVAAIITIMPYFWEKWDEEATQTAIALIPTNTSATTETASPTMTPSDTATATTEPSATYTATITPSDTPQPTSPTNTATNTPESPTPAQLPSQAVAPTQAVIAEVVPAYPCEAKIKFGTGGILNNIHIRPLENSPLRPSVERGATVTVLQKITELAIEWYEIEYAGNSGWVEIRYVDLDGSNCPQ
jgi:cytoskeletal protein RodZ